MTQDEIRRKEWHEFFIKNKNRFTESKGEAEIDKDLIYVEQRRQKETFGKEPYIAQI